MYLMPAPSSAWFASTRPREILIAVNGQGAVELCVIVPGVAYRKPWTDQARSGSCRQDIWHAFEFEFPLAMQ